VDPAARQGGLSSTPDAREADFFFRRVTEWELRREGKLCARFPRARKKKKYEKACDRARIAFGVEEQTMQRVRSSGTAALRARSAQRDGW